MKKLIIITMLIVTFALSAQALFEVKDASDNTVLEVSNDGLRIFNEGDTLMVISSSEIKAFVDASAKDKGLSRSFSVSTSATGKGDSKMFEIVASEGATFYNPDDNTDKILSINQNNIIANVNPTLDRDFIINDQAAGKGGGNLMKISNEDAFVAVDDSTMLWYKQKNAFRVGHVLIADDTEVGQASFASGSKTQASGDFSTSLGYDTEASGFASFATGYGSNAIGKYSVSMGDRTYADGNNSASFGSGSISIGNTSMAIGSSTVSQGSNSFTMGSFTQANGANSVAMGEESIAQGYTSAAIGVYSYSQSYASMSVGRFNLKEGSSNSWIDTDPLFVLGNGTDPSALSNAFEVKKNGNTFVGGGLDVTGNSAVTGDHDVTLNSTVGGTHTVTGDATFSGRIGVGLTPNSSYKLDVQGSHRAVRGWASTTTEDYVYGLDGYAEGAAYRNAGIYASNNNSAPLHNWAGWFNGSINVTGIVSKSASKTTIDHPLDPKNKFLTHATVESDKMMNIYNGVIFLNSDGTAVVTMPDWFESLNTEFRYQLTAIGVPGPNLYISKKISGNTFEISGGSSDMEVSWQVTGVRNDNFAKVNPIEIEKEKDSIEKGYYLHPEAYGLSEKDGIEYQHTKRMEEQSNK